MLLNVCQHCDTEIPEGRRFCDRCGAPVTSAQLQAGEAQPGFKAYYDAWRGYSFQYPEGWRPVPASVGGGTVVESPTGEAVLELYLLPPHGMMTAKQQAELFLRRYGQTQFQIMPGGNDSYAQVVFANDWWQGLLSVHFTSQGGTLGVGRLKNGSTLNIEPEFQQMMGSISLVRPIRRQRWIDPNESAFSISCPVGWNAQSSIKPSPGMGPRVPVFCVTADFGSQVFLSWEMQTRVFLNGELSREPEEDEGFLGMLGRVVKNAGNSMASAMGQPVCPFPGLQPALEHFFYPQWQKEMPGCQLVHFQEVAPNKMDARLRLPDGSIRVYRLQGDAFKVPGMTNQWAGGHVYFYQAPAEMMDQFEPVLKGIADSCQANPQWQAGERNRIQARQQQFNNFHNQMMNTSVANHAARMNDIQSATRSQEAIGQTYSDILDMQMEGWQSRQASSDYIQHETVNSIHGTNDFINPNTGTEFNLPTTYENYWQTGSGDFVIGSDFHLQAPPQWTPLERLSRKPQ